ncbi:MAG: NADH-quinone oxidoreductase subunit NuoK [Deltaproteobacteria bacterium]|nr:NADH-quinone oxidoreductase subunit NuoK [Deltaproteobacteria bacterium]
MPLAAWVILAAALFSIGLYGVTSRRGAIGILLSVELMANAVNLLFISFGRYRGDHLGQVFTLFAVALTVAEVVIGLALVILLHRVRRSDVRVDEVKELHG